MTVFTVFCVFIFCFVSFSVYQKLTNGVCSSKRKLRGRTVIVTGGTAGIGLHIAEDLARRGARVIVACPFPEEGAVGLQYIKRHSGSHNVVFKILDLASIESVRVFAEDILATEDRLDILVNNAGVGFPGDFLSKDDLNFIMQVNYFGSFQLTMLLLPLLIKSGTRGEPSRIINTTSLARSFGRVDIKHLNAVNYYWSTIKIYGNSKLCLVAFADELSKRLQGKHVVVNSVDPGVAGTRIFDSLNKYIGPLMTLLCSAIFKTPRQGAQTALHVAVDEKAGLITGQIFKDCALYNTWFPGYTDESALQLWNESARLVKLSADEIDRSFRSL